LQGDFHPIFSYLDRDRLPMTQLLLKDDRDPFKNGRI
jgi:hypothetical protein